jgi:hypothetical protein
MIMDWLHWLEDDTFQMNVLYSFHTILCTLYGAALKIKKRYAETEGNKTNYNTNHSSKPTMTNTNNFSIIFYKLNYIFFSQLFLFVYILCIIIYIFEEKHNFYYYCYIDVEDKLYVIFIFFLLLFFFGGDNFNKS